MVYAIIMAGGVGTRFWPMSTPERPKQLLRLFRDKPMIELTINRISPLVAWENIRIVTIPEQVRLMTEAVHRLGAKNFIVEPFAKNTAPCIGLAAVHLLAEDPDAVMVVLPADHLITDEAAFLKTVKRGIKMVQENDAIVTLGIEPNRPETGYGYIQYERDEVQSGVHRVVTFAEKPNLETARRFMDTGEFLWNSGVFIWSARRIVSEIEECLPELYAALEDIQEALEDGGDIIRIKRAYQSIKPISIDYGVMERARNVNVVRGKFGWSDVGNWEEAYRLNEHDKDGNVSFGPVIGIDTKDSFLFSEDDRPLAVVGLSNIIAVDTAEGTLICPRDRVQEVRRVAGEVFKMKSKLNPSGGRGDAS